MNEVQQNDWEPLEAAVLADQRQAYDEMRERCPVAHSDFLGWSLFRHEDICAVLANTETYSNVSTFLAIPNGIDPPAHTQFRAALDPNFSQERMAKLEPYAREIAATLLSPLISAGEVEFIEAFATPFALKTLCAWLGWPEKQRELLGSWIDGSQQAAFSKDPVEGEALAVLFSDLVKANLEKRRASPSTVADATDALMSTVVDGVALDDDQIVSVLRNWTAGQGTVAAGLGIVVLHLAQDTELQDSLRNDSSLIPAVIEEILRADGPLVANARTTTREVQIQGRTIPKGEHLTLMWIAGNRDPLKFEHPDTINTDRNTDDSLAWGQGAHVCQGAPLGRLELRVALEVLLSQTIRFELAGNNAPRRDVFPSNGLAALPLLIK